MYQDISTFQSNLSISSDQILEYSSYKPIPGRLLFCYVAENNATASFQKFKDDCMNKYNNSDNATMGWAIISNSNIQPDQNLELLKMINREFNESTKTIIQGLIMISDSNPSPLDDS